MNAPIIVAAILFLIALAVGIYFIFGKKNCKKVATQAKCKAPCKWDIHGGKCIDKDTDPTPAPAPVTPPIDPSAALASNTPTTAPTPASSPDSSEGLDTEDTSFEVPTKALPLADISAETTRAEAPLAECYMSRYADIRQAYKGADIPLYSAQQHYDTYTAGGTESRNTTCYMNDQEAQCYIDRYPDIKEYLGTKSSKKLDRARKHYYEIGHSEGRDFSCGPTTRELQCYFARYPDLQTAYTGKGNFLDARDNTSWYDLMAHWVNHGKGEGRDLLCDDMPDDSQIGQ